MRAHFVVNIKESTEFAPDSVEVTSLVSISCLAGVSVDRIGNPQDRFSLALNGTDETGQILSQLISAHSYNDSQTAGNVFWIHGINDGNQFFGRTLIRDFYTERVVHTATKFQVCSVQLSSSFAYPQHMGGTIIPTTSGRIQTSQGLFIRQKQTLMRSEKVRCCKC